MLQEQLHDVKMATDHSHVQCGLAGAPVGRRIDSFLDEKLDNDAAAIFACVDKAFIHLLRIGVGLQGAVVSEVRFDQLETAEGCGGGQIKTSTPAGEEFGGFWTSVRKACGNYGLPVAGACRLVDLRAVFEQRAEQFFLHTRALRMNACGCETQSRGS